MNEFADIVAQLEQKRAAIERALEALRGVEGSVAPLKRKRGRPPKVVGGLSAQGRKSLSDKMRQRWAIKRAQGTGRKGPAKRKGVKNSAAAEA